MRARVIPLVAFVALLALVQLRAVAGFDNEILHWLDLRRPTGVADALNWAFRLGFAQVDAAIAVGWFALLAARRRSLAAGRAPLVLFVAIGVEVGLRLIVRQPPPDGSYALLRRFADQPLSSVLDRTDAASRQVLVGSVAGPGPATDERGSFPSGHAARSLFLALVAASQRRRLAILACALAAVIGYSALYFGYHWPSDVLGGYLLALVVWQGASALGWLPNATINRKSAVA